MKSLILLVVVLSLAIVGAVPSRSATFSVTTYGAVGDGATDNTTAIQNAVNAAITAGAGNTVTFPAGNFLIKNGPIYVQAVNGVTPTNLTITGASNTTTEILYTNTDPQAFWVSGCTNVAIENMAIDSSVLGITQGTITAINYSTNQVTVAVENGYPLLSRPDLEHPQDTHFRCFPDPNVNNEDDWWGTITAVTPTGSGNTGVVSLTGIPRALFIGERYYIWAGATSNAFVFYYNAGFTLQNINFYGGAVNDLAYIQHNTGSVNITNLVSGPPPSQPDRLLTSLEGMAANQQNRATITLNNCNLSGSWDDAWDSINSGTTMRTLVSQTEVVAAQSGSNDFEGGGTDTVYFYTPAGVLEGQSIINTVTTVPYSGGGNDYDLKITTPKLNGNTATIHSTDMVYDTSMYNKLVLENSTFTANSRRILAGGQSVQITNCHFNNFQLNAIELGTMPESVTITNNVFNHLQSGGIVCEGGAGPGGSNITITGNTFNLEGNTLHSSPGECIVLDGVSTLNISNNTFTRVWGSNIQTNYCSNVTMGGNTFEEPDLGSALWPTAQDQSAVYLEGVNGLNFSGNRILGAQPVTDYFVHSDATDTNTSGITGITFLNDTQVYSFAPIYAQGMRLEVQGGVGAQPGANVQIYSSNGNANQLWKMLYDGDGYWEMQPQEAISQCIDVHAGQNAPGTNVDQYYANMTGAQEYTVFDNGNGSVGFQPECAPGLRLDIYQAGSGDGTNVQIYTATGTDGQEWVPVPITSTLTFDYRAGFVSTTNLALNGSAVAANPNYNGPQILLTDGGANEAGSFYYKTKVNVQAFKTAFRCLVSNPNGDGFTFCIQNAGPTALGAQGGGLGYQGIANSVAIKFDLYNNNGEGSDSTGLYSGGAAPTTPSTDLSATGIQLHSGDMLNVTMAYDGRTLTVRETDMNTGLMAEQVYTVNIPSLVGGNTAYVGFTGGSGGSTAVQQILNWSL